MFQAPGKLCAIVAFYPYTIPAPGSTPPEELRVQVHLAGNQKFAPKYPHFWYQGTHAGFDEHGRDTYDHIASGLAWSRALDCVRRGFGIDVDLEDIWERHLARKMPPLSSTRFCSSLTLDPQMSSSPATPLRR